MQIIAKTLLPVFESVHALLLTLKDLTGIGTHFRVTLRYILKLLLALVRGVHDVLN